MNDNEFEDCFYIHVGSSRDSSRTVEKKRLTKKEISNLVRKYGVATVEGKKDNAFSVEEIEEILKTYKDTDKISIWGDSKSAKIKKGCLVVLVSYTQTEYIGEVVFKVNCPPLSETLWNGVWKYQLGVKNVIKVNIPNEHLMKGSKNQLGYYHMLGIENKGNVQSSNRSKIGKNEVLDRLYKYCVADQFRCVKKYID